MGMKPSALAGGAAQQVEAEGLKVLKAQDGRGGPGHIAQGVGTSLLSWNTRIKGFTACIIT